MSEPTKPRCADCRTTTAVHACPHFAITRTRTAPHRTRTAHRP